MGVFPRVIWDDESYQVVPVNAQKSGISDW